MTPSPKTLLWGLIKTSLALAVVLINQPAIGQESSILGNEIPLIQGAKILKEKQFQGSGRFEFEVDIPPSEAVEFYHQAMQAKGWPGGQIMSTDKFCAIMLRHQGDTFTVKAEDKGDRTYVTLAVILKSPIKKALDPQTAQRYQDATKPLAAPKEKKLPENSSVTIEGTPIGKGDLIRRYQFPHGQGPIIGEKDGGSLPDDPSSPPKDDDPDSEDPPSDDTFPSEGAFDIHDDLPDNLYAFIQATVRWSVTEPDDYEYTGSISLHLLGQMKIWDEASPTIQGAYGAFQPARTYRAEGGTVSYVYDEQRISLKPIPSGHCQDPLIVEYHGGGSMPLSEESLFKFHRYSASAAPHLQNLSADKQKFLSAFKGAMALPDYYELILGPGGDRKRIHGRKKETGKTECAYIPADQGFPGCRIGIQVEPQASGRLIGSRTWQADDQGLCPPSLGISILDIAATQNQKPLKPPAGGNMNVTYTVNWQLSENDPTSQPQEDPLTVENRERDCANMQNRVDYIQIVRAAYGNQAIRDAVKDFVTNENGRKYAYQQAIEAMVAEVEGSNDLSLQEKIDMVAEATGTDVAGTLDEIVDSATTMPADQTTLTDATLKDERVKTLLQACPVFDKQSGRFLGTEIHAQIGGKNVVLEKYDANGELAQSIDPDAILSEWEACDGKWAGRSLLDNALRHERVHVRQFTKVQGELKTMDMLGDWELEAYQTEMDGLLKDLDEDC
jgi:hypothetical protein